ncbi:MAG: sulfatase-like hydrolase/transferase [Oceanipulchritudo sp.]
MPSDNGFRPNFLFIMCDQLRHDWLGCRGATHGATPNIDRIAARGKVFTQAVCNSPVCAPSRIGLASGIRPHRLGALNNDAFLPLSWQRRASARATNARLNCIKPWWNRYYTKWLKETNPASSGTSGRITGMCSLPLWKITGKSGRAFPELRNFRWALGGYEPPPNEACMFRASSTAFA